MIKPSVLIVSIVSVFLIKGTLSVNIIADSQNLWIQSGWNIGYDVPFGDCSKLADNNYTPYGHNFCRRYRGINPLEWNKPFIQSFAALLDFYHPFIAPGPGEAHLVDEFLDEFIKLPIGIELQTIIVGAGGAVYVGAPDVYKAFLKQIWFGAVHVPGRKNGFRHVFVGEKRNPAVLTGFHNWYQFYLQLCLSNPSNGYGGFLFNYRLDVGGGNQPADVKYCKVAINWNGIRKGISTILFGSRPEYDFAVFTLCFYKTGFMDGECTTDIGAHAQRNIQVVRNNGAAPPGGSWITTAYFR